MAVDATQATGAATSATAAIRKASQVTGAKFSYLLATAKVESNLNPYAAAKTSSAGGLFQFIDRTWLGTLKEAGPLLGYSRYADAITRSPDGQYSVSDPAMRREIMALRQDPTANALMAGVFTNSNAKQLTSKLGRAPTDGELYIAHFMGASGAARLISQAESTPNGVAAQGFPSAARANRSIFFDKSGRARNFAEVAQNLSNRFNLARARTPGLDAADAAMTTATVQPGQTTSFVPETARVARAYQVADAAQRIPALRTEVVQQTVQRTTQNVAPGQGQFHNPYRAGERRQPVSQAVAEIWTRQNRTSQQEAVRQMAMQLEGRSQAVPQQQPQAAPQVATQAAAQTTRANAGAIEPLGLFQDIKPDVRSLFTHGVRG